MILPYFLSFPKIQYINLTADLCLNVFLRIFLLVEGQATLLVAGQRALLVAGQRTLLAAGQATLLVAGKTTLQVAGMTTLLVAGQTTLLVAGQTPMQVAGQTTLLVAGQTPMQVAGQTTLLVAGHNTRNGETVFHLRVSTLSKCSTKSGKLTKVYAANFANNETETGKVIYVHMSFILLISGETTISPEILAYDPELCNLCMI